MVPNKHNASHSQLCRNHLHGVKQCTPRINPPKTRKFNLQPQQNTNSNIKRHDNKIQVIDPNNRFTYLSDSEDDAEDDDIYEDDNKADTQIEIPKSDSTTETGTNSETIPPQRVADVPATIDSTVEHEPTSNTAPASIIDTIAAANTEKWPAPRKITHQHYTPASAKAAYVLANAPQYTFFGNAINPDTGKLAEYLELSKSTRGPLWIDGMTLEIGKLLGTETMKFIAIKDIPPGTKITYAKIVCADRPEKENPICVWLTIGGNLITYDGTTSTKSAKMPTVKIFINSILSTPHAKFMTGDIKDFYLNTAKMPSKDFAYMRITINVIPSDIIKQYAQLIYKDHVYLEVSKGIYGLPQAGKLANEQLIRHLAPYGYAPCPITPRLWKHDTRQIAFLLVVDDFGIKYTDCRDVEHLLNALRDAYKISVDWDGE